MARRKVIQFSSGRSTRSMLKCRLKIPGEEMFSRRSPPSIARYGGQIPERLLSRLRRLDAEQLQVVEIVVVAISRGAAIAIPLVAL